VIVVAPDRLALDDLDPVATPEFVPLPYIRVAGIAADPEAEHSSADKWRLRKIDDRRVSGGPQSAWDELHLRAAWIAKATGAGTVFVAVVRHTVWKYREALE
jgi:hypothetical protein